MGGEPVIMANTSEEVPRKPYELLLLGRQGTTDEVVGRTIVASVPTGHSRKPYLLGKCHETGIVVIRRAQQH